MSKADASLVLQVITTAIAVWIWWRDRPDEPPPGRHRRKKR
jgi:hypothetical protein